MAYQEDFQNTVNNQTVLLTDYVGATGQRYTAAPSWLTACNGQIVNFNGTQAGNCQSQFYAATQQLAWALGSLNGSPNPATNNAVTAFTENSPGANAVQFQTVSNIPLANSSGRYLTFSVDTAAVNCANSAPRYQFAFLNASGTATNVGGIINACSSGRTIAAPTKSGGTSNVTVGTYTSNGSVLFTGSTLGIQMRNANGSNVGNDAAFDNLRILDVTPQLDKAFSPTEAMTGGTSTLTFTITNTSELAAKNGWSFTDTFPAGLQVATPSGATTNCASGVVTATAGGTSISGSGNLNSGQASCTMSVNVRSTTPGAYTNGPGNVSTVGLNPPADATVSFANPSVRILKTAGTPTDVNGDTVIGAGDSIPYSFLVTNTGDVSLSAVGVNDPKVGTVTCPTTILAAGGSQTCTATYIVTAEDAAAGSVVNTATAVGTPPGRSPISSTPSSTTTPVTALAPALSLVKSATPSGPETFIAGQQIAYTFAVTNKGNVPLNNIQIDERTFTGSAGMGTITCPPGTLAVGASVTCTAPPYTITQTDVDAGGLYNTAVAAGTVTDGGPVISNESEFAVPGQQSPAIEVVKSATPSTITAAGQNVAYSFVVTNTGNVTLSDVGIDELDFSGTGTPPVASCPTVPLAPGASATCEASYSATQADVDVGQITNTATATGLDTSGDEITSDPSKATVTATQTPALTIVKSASPATGASFVVGETVTYSFLVTNSGNVTLTDVAVDESTFTGAGTLSAISCPSTESLAPSATVTCTATYEFVQEDIDRGSVENSATATGTPPGGGTIDSPPSSTVVPSSATGALALVKSATPTAITASGQPITYSFVLTNTGDVTLFGATVQESAFTGSGVAPAVTCPASAAVLEPDQTVTCTATYTSTQADVDAGRVDNTATATATTRLGESIGSTPSSATVVADAQAELQFTKRADPLAEEDFVVGQQITYSFVLANTGNVTLSNPRVEETEFTGTGAPPVVACPPGSASIAPGTSITCTATYTITQGDVDNGSVDNIAVGFGTPPGGDEIETPPSGVTVPGVQNPSLSITKSALPSTVAAAGRNIVYSFRVQNTGNVTLSAVDVQETAFSGTGQLGEIACPPGSETLAPGAIVTCTAIYTTTQADVDAGQLTNEADASAVDPNGGVVDAPPSDAIVNFAQAPAISLTKSADPISADSFVVGQQVTYSFVARNTGNVTLTDVSVTEGTFTGSGELSAIDCPAVTSLAPDATLTCSATYTLTQADIDQGSIVNSATAQGTPPGGPEIASPPSEVTTPGTQNPALAILKTADVDSITDAGQVITYSFEVRNIGNVTVTDVGVNDELFTGTGELSALECPDVTTIMPGESVVCTATYAATQADVDSGQIANTATGTGTPPSGPPITTTPSTEIVAVLQEPGLTLVKSVTPETVSVAGDEVTYSFGIVNTGNVTLTGVSIGEERFSGTGDLPAPECPSTSLSPGEGMTCTATYALTQADVDAGEVTNSARALGTPPGATRPIRSDPSTADVAVPATAALEVLKTADVETITNAGESVTFSFAVTNTGNVTLSNVTFDESGFTGSGELSPIDCAAASIAPGDTIVCVATYVVTQADIESGQLTNIATATGITPGGDPSDPSPPSEVTVPVTSRAGISVVKSVTLEDGAFFSVGEELTYSFVATNTGNITLADVTINDVDFSGSGELSEIACASDGPLAPGSQVLCTATYALTQADVDSGEVTNTATATGTPVTTPDAPITSTPSSAVVPGLDSPSLSIVKTADVQRISEVGQTVTYSFLITNTGDVTIADPAVEETEFSGTGELSEIVCGDDVSLLPGEQVECTATYEATQADLDSGSLTNTATATGTPPGATPLVPSTPSTVDVPTDPQPSLEIVKTADVETVTRAGQVVTYTFTVTNTGNITMEDVAIDDVEFSGTGQLSPIACAADVQALAPGAVLECTATYVVTQADLTADELSNTATVTATPPVGSPPTPESSTVVIETDPGGPLPVTGAAVSPAGVAAALALLVLGAFLISRPLLRRRIG